ncbi:reverse transcriptase domain-containing protein [Salegentibacter sp. F188]|uniref:RNA-directed DNA polymerase n=1 Tax=Autumnicola patrickiae TaxID=3075591 RepID=A0ABU3E5E9_9FLAO|nr:reverse transcriptase domain-containing protein [Salegentibacter sp. F188]MDT0690869.1 reverse transcriptase domain-containing protein [Salegentibacter sp. F188]
MSGVFLDKLLIENTKKRFDQINNLKDFVSLLNYLELRAFKDPQKPLTVPHLYYLSKTKNNRYEEFDIPKKNGETRKIKSPDGRLKRVQGLINILLQIVFEGHSNYSTNGFLFGKDIKRNALPHVNKNYLLNIDLQNFFPSIPFRRIKTVLELPPFNLVSNRETIGFLIANLGTYKNSLPQGAPTSPILSNIVTQRLDRKIVKYCIDHRIKYSRYADDLSFSSNWNVFESNIIKEIEGIVKSENFTLNSRKTRVRSSMQRQEVTGLVVNSKLNVKREYLQKVRAMINNWEKGGFSFAIAQFRKHQPPEKKFYDFKEVLLGHISFLRLIKGENNSVIQNLQIRYNFLVNLLDYSFIEEDNVRLKIEEDNQKMEKIAFENDQGKEETFISFCTGAFHQIENLLNFYYWKKFPEIDDLKDFMWHNNPLFQERWKKLRKSNKENRLKQLNNYKTVRDFDINTLVYLFEKEFYFDRHKSYKQKITHLREIRNDESHRCTVLDTDKEAIRIQYEKIRKERKAKKEKGKQFILTPGQQKDEMNYLTLKYIEEKNYKNVRNVLREVRNNIKKSLPNIGLSEILGSSEIA